MKLNMWQSALCGVAITGLLAGCADRPSQVPDSASLVSEGASQLVYTASRPGVVWVDRADNKKIIYSASVHRGDVLVLDPKRNQITLNGRTVFNEDLGGIQYQIYFNAQPVNSMESSADLNVSRPSGVPADADLRGEGRQRVQYTSNVAGRLWVSDVDSDSIVYSGTIAPGDKVVIDPAHSALTINGAMVTSRAAINGDDHRIFVESGEARSAGALATPALTRPAAVPSDALLRSQGMDAINVKPDRDGTVWVVSNDDGRVIYSGRMLAGDRLMVDPKSSQLSLNGHAVYDRPLTGQSYCVYFKTDTAR